MKAVPANNLYPSISATAIIRLYQGIVECLLKYQESVNSGFKSLFSVNWKLLQECL
jgi:hypothetical protein